MPKTQALLIGEIELVEGFYVESGEAEAAPRFYRL